MHGICLGPSQPKTTLSTSHLRTKRMDTRNRNGSQADWLYVTLGNGAAHVIAELAAVSFTPLSVWNVRIGSEGAATEATLADTHILWIHRSMKTCERLDHVARDSVWTGGTVDVSSGTSVP
jgi:hypothetical protein